ncbi:MAG: hypothetical protein K9I71_11035 [Ignavibacteriales bacterium]|nr:hypothetical protein [Ignavibacteriales bacterium]MCF8316654.1 hypothetical protein [Ignavibacteriales bacterium]MCF8438310.1 hypothetical protein [Ignavibacteriales bacterium]
MKTFVEIDLENNGNYLKMLSAISKLSGLFSESSIPFINYRVAENIFCRSFNADNLSRSDTAFDANFNSLGVGLKTFTCPSSSSLEKVAEFNSLSRILSRLNGKELASKLSEFRNERIDLASRTYNLKSSLYHIVARRQNELILFETDYEKIDLVNIYGVKSKTASLQFEDGKNSYLFNHSKNTLYRRFIIPRNAYRFPVEIIENPYDLLLELFKDRSLRVSKDKLVSGVNYIILPLYGFRKKQKFVFEKSGLNQWNASGRKRDYGEVYIPIPIQIHRFFPDFFPPRDVAFNLKVPSGEVLSAKICQDNSKALMTNPNNALSDWLLRKVLKLQEGELATFEKLNSLGFDSVIIRKTDNENYSIDKAIIDSYEYFISSE